MTTKKLNEILDQHAQWRQGNNEGARANLSGANLFGANLSRANLSRANLSRADLSGANLSEADLFGANLSGANLSGADLFGANLSMADLSMANLSRANLSRANLSGADLSWMSHDLISFVLFSAADNVEKRKIAGLIKISTDWCWQRFFALNDPMQPWAVSVLRKYITDKTPENIKNYLKIE